MKAKLVGISMLNIMGKEARHLVFEIVSAQQGESHIALGPELRNIAQMAGLSQESLMALFNTIQQLQGMQQKYNFTLIIYNDEYIDLGINFDVGKIYEFIFEGGKIQIKLEE
ncbi:MAG: hypothetical protein RXP30_06985 [Thermoplasmata archaeon]|jgi:hypothetical protein|nr:hypothetical protein [Thermoplasmata archaeon]MVT13650.1 hypothetical protein [Euryarchaeota archaeon]MVT14620.1 hypothetical protein [Euryarchaeota archaeon]MVT35573.1 hypothetical protein [Euryarchaeota archaeon]